MIYFNIIALVLSVWRITEIVITQDGPFSVFKRLRPRWKVLQCPFCFSVWASAIGVFLYHFFPCVNWIFALSWTYGFSSMFARRLSTWANEVAKKGRELLVAENNGQISVVRTDFTAQEQLRIFSAFKDSLSCSVK
jgi:hypothetical protein